MNSPASSTDPFASRGLRQRTLLLLPILAALLAAALWRLELTYDLAYFLPAPISAQQQVLVDRLGQGPGADLIFVTLPNATDVQVETLAEQLRSLTAFKKVWPDAQLDALALPKVLRDNRLLLGDLPNSTAQWQALLNERLLDVRSAPDDAIFETIAEDPALLSLNAIQAHSGHFDANTLLDQQPPTLVLQSTASVFDLDQMAVTQTLLQQALTEAGLPEATMFGSGLYGVALQDAVRTESILFSILASIALAALVLWRFRSFTALVSAALPLLLGAITGLLALSLVSNTVHGITLAFGFTLLGVAVDYPLHLFTHHSVAPGARTQQLWATLRLGIASTLMAYGAFLLSGTGGLMQLGLFASVGIAAAALATAYLGIGMNDLTPPTPVSAQVPEKATAQQLSHGPWLLAMALVLPILASQPLFNDDLGSLTPVPAETLAADSALRARLGTVDLRYLVAIRADQQQQVLERTEALTPTLQGAIDQQLLRGYQSISTLLPSRQQQKQRRSAVQSQLGNDWFAEAVTTSGFNASAFAPFTAALQQESKRTDWLTWDALTADADLETMLSGQLYQRDNHWYGLVYLRGLTKPSQFSDLLNQHPNAELVDLKEASISLVRDYRARLLTVLALALVAITLLLWLRTADLRRALWLLGTVCTAVALAAAGSALLVSTLSLFDLMALALVAGLGLDYALFYSRPNLDPVDAQAVPKAVLICAASSLLVFGILSLSSIPLLKGIGTTVALGVISAYLLARGGRYVNPTT